MRRHMGENQLTEREKLAGALSETETENQSEAIMSIKGKKVKKNG